MSALLRGAAQSPDIKAGGKEYRRLSGIPQANSCARSALQTLGCPVKTLPAATPETAGNPVNVSLAGVPRRCGTTSGRSPTSRCRAPLPRAAAVRRCRALPRAAAAVPRPPPRAAAGADSGLRAAQRRRPPAPSPRRLPARTALLGALTPPPRLRRQTALSWRALCSEIVQVIPYRARSRLGK